MGEYVWIWRKAFGISRHVWMVAAHCKKGWNGMMRGLYYVLYKRDIEADLSVQTCRAGSEHKVRTTSDQLSVIILFFMAKEKSQYDTKQQHHHPIYDVRPIYRLSAPLSIRWCGTFCGRYFCEWQTQPNLFVLCKYFGFPFFIFTIFHFPKRHNMQRCLHQKNQSLSPNQS